MEEQTPLQSTPFTNRQLKWSYWYVTHRLLIRKWITIILAIIAFLFWLFVGWQMVFYAIEYQPEDLAVRKMIAGASTSLDTIEGHRPVPAQFSDITRLDGGVGRYDYYIKATNTNLDWLVTFDYQFVASGDQTQVKKGFILPGETKVIMDLGIESQTVQVRISNQKWERIRGFSQIADDRFRPHIADEDFTAGALTGDPHRVNFNIKNESGFSYWEFGIQVFLLSRGEIVSANYIALDKFEAGETAPVELHWNHVLPIISGLQIIPEVNFLDDNNIMPPK